MHANVTFILLIYQVTPLTALKFAELTVKAGIPKGVINIIPGSGKYNDTLGFYMGSTYNCLSYSGLVNEQTPIL